MGEAKAKKWRACPAAGREIAGQECGDGRHGRYACPPGCPFDPFDPANYGQILKLEDELDQRSFKALLTEDLGAAESIRAHANVGGGMGMHAATVWRMFFHRDGSGRTFAERWAGAGKLRNDDRVLWRGKAATRASVFEVGRIIDHERFEVTDLLAPGRPRMMVIDRSMAARAARFQTFVTWMYPLPHYWRFSGSGVEVLRHGMHAPETVARELIRHLGGPEAAEDAGRWLAENFVRVCTAIEAVAHTRRRRMFEAMDARFGRATYGLTVSVDKALEVLAKEAAIDRDELSKEERVAGLEVALVWFADDAPGGGERAVGRPVMGRVLLGKRIAKVEAMGGARLNVLRERFEARMGKRVKFEKERRDDFGGRMAAEELEVDESLVPPRLLEDIEEIALQSSRIPLGHETSAAEVQEAFIAEHQRRWMDMALPSLEGKTPREAAGDLLLRGRVVELVKQQLLALDRENLRTGGARDLGWMVRELGLAEIDVPAPGRRPRLDVDAENAEVEEATARSNECTALPAGRPLTEEEAVVRIDVAISGFDRAADALAELDALGVTLMADIDAMTRQHLSDADFGFLVPYLLQVWFGLVPRGQAPSLRRAAMKAAFESDFARLRGRGPGAEHERRRIFLSSRQPRFLQVIQGGMLEIAHGVPKKERPGEPALLAMGLVLKAVVDAVDEAVRS